LKFKEDFRNFGDCFILDTIVSRLVRVHSIEVIISGYLILLNYLIPEHYYFIKKSDTVFSGTR